jgi:Rod binding domain-containing protein
VSGVGGIGRVGAAGPDQAGGLARDQEKLRRLSHEFEGLFLKQMLDVMRQSIPQGGLIESSMGEEVFTSLLDERLASEAARRSQGGLGDALCRQLARRLDDGDKTSR